MMDNYVSIFMDMSINDIREKIVQLRESMNNGTITPRQLTQLQEAQAWVGIVKKYGEQLRFEDEDESKEDRAEDIAMALKMKYGIDVSGQEGDKGSFGLDDDTGMTNGGFEWS